jgi:hypothetical protein
VSGNQKCQKQRYSYICREPKVSKIEMKNDEYLYDKHGNTNHNVKWYNLKGVAICYETGTEEKQELLFEVERK